MNSEITNTVDTTLLSKEGLRETEVVLKFKLWHINPSDRPPVDEFRSILDFADAVKILQNSAINQTTAEGHKVVATWNRTEISDHRPTSSHTEVY